MSITIRIEGLEELRRSLTNLDTRIDDVIQDAIEGGVLKAHTEIVDDIHRGPATGRVYRRKNITHRASAPGEAPMTDRGRLVNSIKFGLEPNGAFVGSALAYATYLEYGTSKMAPRPVWTPAAERLRERLPRDIEAALAKALK